MRLYDVDENELCKACEMFEELVIRPDMCFTPSSISHQTFH